MLKLKFYVLHALKNSQDIKKVEERMKQTKKLKSTYPQLVVFGNNKPITFYPQAGVEQEISIKGFLEELLKREIKILYAKFEIEDNKG